MSPGIMSGSSIDVTAVVGDMSMLLGETRIMASIDAGCMGTEVAVTGCVRSMS